MNFKICSILALLFTFGYCINLERICEGTFEHKGVTVNSILRVEYNRTLKPVDYPKFMSKYFNNFSSFFFKFIKAYDYQLGEFDDFEEYFDDVQPMNELKELRIIYNELMIEIYSDYYTEKKLYRIDKDNYVMNKIFANVTEIKKEVVKNPNGFEKYVVKKFKLGFDLVSALYNNYHSKFYFADDMQEKNKCEHIFYQLEESNEVISGLQNDPLTKIFTYEILSQPKMIMTRYNLNFFDERSNATLTTNIILPYFDPKLKDRKNCVNVTDLPFYKNYLN